LITLPYRWQHLERSPIFLFHAMEQNVSERIGVDSFERMPKGPLTRHVELSTLPPDAECISVDAVVRKLRLSAKSAIARSPLQAAITANAAISRIVAKP